MLSQPQQRENEYMIMHCTYYLLYIYLILHSTPMTLMLQDVMSVCCHLMANIHYYNVFDNLQGVKVLHCSLVLLLFYLTFHLCLSFSQFFCPCFISVTIFLSWQYPLQGEVQRRRMASVPSQCCKLKCFPKTCFL